MKSLTVYYCFSAGIILL